MDKEFNKRLFELFDAALQLDNEARTVFLEQACKGNEELLKQINALLSSAEDEPHTEFLFPELFSHPDDKAEDVAGVQFGAFRLIRKLGEGGMGLVYLAERTDGAFEQQVAIKLIKRGMDSQRILKRFMHERQILAGLTHPNIGQLYDGGITKEGISYFVMEYVDGIPITEYCDRHNMSLEDRISLFTQVCKAVQYAHQNLIVHRDLKPSNILVTQDRHVKLLDFGIAKVLGGGEAAANQPQTIEEARLMTPQYAAPEQVRAEAITTSTDIYALGLILYEILTGHRPYTISSLRMAEVERVICNEPPRRPSTIILDQESLLQPPENSSEEGEASTGGGRETLSIEGAGATRGTTPSRWKRWLQGDMDTILLKALRKEPERRYASAERLSDDLQRFLQGLPVLAQPDTFGYRARKFMQRNYRSVAISALFLAAVITIVTLYTVQLREARDEAQVEQQKAQQVTDVLVEFFAASDPAVARGETMTAREVLDIGARRLQGTLVEPSVQAALLSAIGKAYHGLGLFSAADSALQTSLVLVQQEGDTNPAELVANLNELTRLRISEEVYKAADSINALALQWSASSLDPNAEEAIESRHLSGVIQLETGQYVLADSMLKQALDDILAMEGAMSLRAAEYRILWASALNEQGRSDEAEYQLRESIAVQSEQRENVHPNLIKAEQNLAAVLLRQERVLEADSILTAILERQRYVQGDQHPDLVTTLNSWGSLRPYFGDWEGGEMAFREGLEIIRTSFGDDPHPAVPVLLLNMGMQLEWQGRSDEAEQNYRESLAIQRSVLRPDDPEVAYTLNNLGTLLLQEGRREEAEVYYREALDLRQKTLGDHKETALSLFNLAVLYDELGDKVQADSVYQRSSEMLRQTQQGEPSMFLALSLIGSARLHIPANDTARVEPLIDEAMDIYEHMTENGIAFAPGAESVLGECLSFLHRFEVADSMLVRSYEAIEGAFGTEHERTLDARERLFDHYVRWDKKDLAMQYQSNLAL